MYVCVYLLRIGCVYLGYISIYLYLTMWWLFCNNCSHLLPWIDTKPTLLQQCTYKVCIAICIYPLFNKRQYRVCALEQFLRWMNKVHQKPRLRYFIHVELIFHINILHTANRRELPSDICWTAKIFLGNEFFYAY